MTNRAERLCAATLPTWLRALRTMGFSVMWFVLALVTLWAVAALYVDIRVDGGDQG